MLLSKRCVLAHHTGGYSQYDGSSIALELIPFIAGTQTAYFLSDENITDIAACQDVYLSLVNPTYLGILSMISSNSLEEMIF